MLHDYLVIVALNLPGKNQRKVLKEMKKDYYRLSASSCDQLMHMLKRT